MQIVINIDEQLIELAQKELIMGGDMPTLANAISNGKVLPKGHGRLIDEDEIPGDGSWDFSDRLDATPTIIEADKE